MLQARSVQFTHGGVHAHTHTRTRMHACTHARMPVEEEGVGGRVTDDHHALELLRCEVHLRQLAPHTSAIELGQSSVGTEAVLACKQ